MIMIEEIRKISSDDNIKEMACEYTGAEEEYQGFILGCNVLADEIEELVKNCSIPDVSQQRELLLAFMEFYHSDPYCPANTTFKIDVDAFLANYSG